MAGIPITCILDITTGHNGTGCYDVLCNEFSTTAPNVFIGGENPGFLLGYIGAHCNCDEKGCHAELIAVPAPKIFFKGVQGGLIGPTSMKDTLIAWTSPARKVFVA